MTASAALNDSQLQLLGMIVEVADRTESGVCPSIYSHNGNTLRALARRGLVTFERHVCGSDGYYDRYCYSASPTQAGRETARLR